MLTKRKSLIAKRFNRRASEYSELAGLQYQVACKLADYLPQSFTSREQKPLILELGCGTGFLTEHLLKLYPDANLWTTDIAKSMVQHCMLKYSEYPNVSYAQLDGEYLQSSGSIDLQNDMPPTFDLILSSMVMQWFEDPAEALRRQMKFLNKNGQILFATLGQDSFSEWREILTALDLPTGTINVGSLPGILTEETITTNFGSDWKFLKHLNAIGARTPSPDYKPIGVRDLKKALRQFDDIHNGKISWHIVYGCIRL